MATMREFNKCDKVVCVGKPYNAALTQGKVYHVIGSSKYGIKVINDNYNEQSVSLKSIMHERDYVEMCLQAIIDRNIVVSAYRNIRKRGDDAWYCSAAEFLSEYYPLESPAQKELRELKEQAKELHDKIAELEEKAK
jgi:hypothetical protein